eukprot:TRINITY_DN363_c0_g1_i4.p2 TRINITY_DN363_c0_g1~~TRINITY_DN363_c0_g1_i4.p2  ORF type:complete len:121 (+),score=7.00 TRINITY_DN363_c0_g1_i4:735-1097(+)
MLKDTLNNVTDQIIQYYKTQLSEVKKTKSLEFIAPLVEKMSILRREIRSVEDIVTFTKTENFKPCMDNKLLFAMDVLLNEISTQIRMLEDIKFVVSQVTKLTELARLARVVKNVLREIET